MVTRFFLVILLFVVVLGLLFIIGFAYEWLRCKTNKVRIGVEYFLCKLLKRGDYVSLKGRIMRFSHITRCGEVINPIRPPLNDNKALGGEIAFYDPHSLGYQVYNLTSLRLCDFIYGKYGLKWASTKSVANTAKDLVDEAVVKGTV